MSTQQLSPIRKAWYRWKSLRFPWRKRFFVGLDLQSNSFWEFRDAINAGRMRRIVQAPPLTQYSDVRISPQWHQWLRHTRADAPSIEELLGDVARQERLKILARQADERWNAKASFLDKPAAQQASLATQVRDGGAFSVVEPREDGKGVANAVGGEHVEKERAVFAKKPAGSKTLHDGETLPREEKKYQEDPWKKARGGPSEEWQPKAWDPNDMPLSRR
ncbi:0294aedc-f7f3-4439-bb9a-e73838e30635 [Sclerotinia trifoliorum]|uniref:0294aedc-f7f3-4439-bb9a-e73838e30635 n=1 Tax=Sclerotinia trifoliorum TaxID=28548 RepID=A0A8H2W3Y3_9HELO|nr:0294aedc-f7f3-4439-bb9a-e73838e30635 [Sclerotinia trifoliorum]